MDVNKGPIAWFVHNPIAANLLLFAVLIFGFISLQDLRTELMPKPESRIIHIAAFYPGASPSEVEQNVTLRIEDAIGDVSGIKKITSNAYANKSLTQIEVDDGFDINEVREQLKVATDNISSLPNDVEKVLVAKPASTEMALQIQLYGNLTEEKAKVMVEEIKRDILANTIIKKVNVWGTRPYEISIEVDKEQLQRYQLTLGQIAKRIKAESVNLPSGSIELASGSSVAIRVEGQAYRQQDFEEIVLLTSEDGRIVRLGDIASVKDEFVNWNTNALFDGQFSVGLAIIAVGEQDAIKVAEAAKAYVKEKQKTLPEGVYIETWADITYYLDSRLTMMTTNMLWGALLVVLVLALFMDLKMAFWVMAGLPFCYFGVFLVMPLQWIDVSINMVSLFGFILVLGIIVDDAIVVTESVNTEVEENGLSNESVIKGTKNVALASVFGVLTTVIAFLPTLFLEGPYQVMPYSIGAVVCLTLLFSLVESKWILPSHLASTQSGFSKYISFKWQDRFQKSNNQKLKSFLSNRYQPVLEKLIAPRYRYSCILAFIALFFISLSMVSHNIVKYELFPADAHDFLQVKVEMGDGTPKERTAEVMQLVSDSIKAVEANYKDTSGSDIGLVSHLGSSQTNTNTGVFIVELVKEEFRDLDSFEIVERWQRQLGEITDAKRINFSGVKQSNTRSISYMLVSSDKKQLKAAAQAMYEKMQSYNGLFDVYSSVAKGQPEFVLKLKPKAHSLNLTLADVSLQVREAFYGAEAQRFPRDNEEVKVMVRYPEESRKNLINLQDMNIRTPDGRFIPLQELAFIEYGFAENQIQRVNGQAAAVISAKVSQQENNLGKIKQEVGSIFLTNLLHEYPHVQYRPDGASLEQQKIEGDLNKFFFLALLAVFILLAIPLKSYVQPVIIMSAIPFGIVGAIWGHWLLDFPISFMSIFGIIALSGVVVNDSLLMVDYINRAKLEGLSLSESVCQAGVKRFRAIMLTTLTTFVGLLPMLFESSLQAKNMIPMAVSLGFGIIFATVITLLLVPCLYLVTEDIKGLFKRLFA